MFDVPGSAQTVGLFTGQHVLAEMEGIHAGRLDDELFLRHTLEQALDRAGATVCGVMSKRFHPQGVTVLALLSESHASLHTYPEKESAFVDVFTCGNQADPELAVKLIAEDMGALRVQTRTIRRGQDEQASAHSEKARTS